MSCQCNGSPKNCLFGELGPKIDRLNTLQSLIRKGDWTVLEEYSDLECEVSEHVAECDGCSKWFYRPDAIREKEWFGNSGWIDYYYCSEDCFNNYHLENVEDE